MRSVAVLVIVASLVLPSMSALALHSTQRPWEPGCQTGLGGPSCFVTELPRAGPVQNYPHPIDGDNRMGCYPQHPRDANGNPTSDEFIVDLPCRNADGGLGLVPSGPFIDNQYMADEPNVIADIEKPYRTFPADENFMSIAKQGLAPELILNQMLGNYCVFDGDWACTYNEYVKLYAPFTNAPYFLIPGTTYGTVFHGWWTDLNGDGFITGTNIASDAFVFWAPHREYRTGGQEWAGRCSPIVGYLSPHNVAAASTDREADIVYGPQVCGKGLQRVDSGGFVMSDVSLLETIVTEAYSDVEYTPGGDRDWTPVVDPLCPCLHDTDAFKAVDPTLETLYINTVKVARDTALTTANGAVATALATVENAAPLVGGTVAPLVAAAVQSAVPRVTPEISGYDHSLAYKPYLDVHMAAYYSSCHVFCAATVYGNITPPLGLNGEESFMPGWMGAVARFGYWWDKNGDGWIGEPGYDSACGDAYDCGLDSDPNRYSVEESNGEFSPACATTYRPPTGLPYFETINVTLTPRTEGQLWVPVPVGTEIPNGGGENIPFDAEGRTTHVGTGVVVFDDPPGSQDGEIILGTGLGVVRTALGGKPYFLPPTYHLHTVEQGPITLRLDCGGVGHTTTDLYWSWQTLLFPSGNMDFDIDLVSQDVPSVSVQFGVTAGMTVRDEDVLVAWG
ncbi:MAG TPA: hypothetical protein VI997_10345 [Candidatus Thermoplasmatota archaeon]|nr:hypothetical protein [Candidatus Thermoplasmatota archaeon]